MNKEDKDDIIYKYVDVCVSKSYTLFHTLEGIPNKHHKRIEKLYKISREEFKIYLKSIGCVPGPS